MIGWDPTNPGNTFQAATFTDLEIGPGSLTGEIAIDPPPIVVEEASAIAVLGSDLGSFSFEMACDLISMNVVNAFSSDNVLKTLNVVDMSSKG